MSEVAIQHKLRNQTSKRDARAVIAHLPAVLIGDGRAHPETDGLLLVPVDGAGEGDLEVVEALHLYCAVVVVGEPDIPAIYCTEPLALLFPFCRVFLDPDVERAGPEEPNEADGDTDAVGDGVEAVFHVSLPMLRWR